jgi:uncharacterized protein YceK
MKRSIFVLSFAVLAMMQTGCETIASHVSNNLKRDLSGRDERLGIYPGVRFDAHASWMTPAAIVEGQPLALLFEPIWIADLPLSGVVDTCRLPWDCQ